MTHPLDGLRNVRFFFPRSVLEFFEPLSIRTPHRILRFDVPLRVPGLFSSSAVWFRWRILFTSPESWL